MNKFRKKPVVIEAAQWDGTLQSATPIINWILDSGSRCARYVEVGVMHIDTLEGQMTASAGDWIIRGISGEHYPCKPDIFAATYEPAEDA